MPGEGCAIPQPMQIGYGTGTRGQGGIVHTPLVTPSLSQNVVDASARLQAHHGQDEIELSILTSGVPIWQPRRVAAMELIQAMVSAFSMRRSGERDLTRPRMLAKVHGFVKSITSYRLSGPASRIYSWSQY